MPDKKYGTIVYILRGQPLHKGHTETIKQAGFLADNVVILIGSAFRPRDYKNPFTFQERKDMVMDAIQELSLNQITGAKFWIQPITDTIYDDNAWVCNVQKAVYEHATTKEKIGIIGHEKDDSSFYLKMFPQWNFESQDLIDPLDATQIRSLYFTEKPNTNLFASVIAKSTKKFLDAFMKTPAFAQVVRERKFIETYKKQFESLPYPPIFVTVDAVVVQSGHVLLVKRRSEPGKGLWAFPGGFVNANTDKSIEQAMLRELKEETQIKLPEKVLKGSIKNQKVFDAIGRSARGRTITHAFQISLTDGEWSLPKVKGEDDAEKAKWVPISQVKSEEMFEDHYDIFRYFVPGI